MIKDTKKESKYILYIVKENDTLNSIANQYDVSVKSIIKINELDDTNIVVGQQLYIKPNNQAIPIWILVIMLTALIAGTAFVTFSITDYVNNGGGSDIGGSNSVDVGTVLFSFNEADNTINIPNAYPTADEAGKIISKSEEYFDFQVTFDLQKLVENSEVTYQVNLTDATTATNKLDPSYVKVYLEENGSAAEGFSSAIPLFSDLEDSTLRVGSKVLYTKTITKTQTNSYRFRMWVSDNYQVDEIQRTFSCLVNIDGYVEQ